MEAALPFFPRDDSFAVQDLYPVRPDSSVDRASPHSATAHRQAPCQPSEAALAFWSSPLTQTMWLAKIQPLLRERILAKRTVFAHPLAHIARGMKSAVLHAVNNGTHDATGAATWEQLVEYAFLPHIEPFEDLFWPGGPLSVTPIAGTEERKSAVAPYSLFVGLLSRGDPLAETIWFSSRAINKDRPGGIGRLSEQYRTTWFAKTVEETAVGSLEVRGKTEGRSRRRRRDDRGDGGGDGGEKTKTIKDLEPTERDVVLVRRFFRSS